MKLLSDLVESRLESLETIQGLKHPKQQRNEQTRADRASEPRQETLSERKPPALMDAYQFRRQIVAALQFINPRLLERVPFFGFHTLNDVGQQTNRRCGRALLLSRCLPMPACGQRTAQQGTAGDGRV